MNAIKVLIFFNCGLNALHTYGYSQYIRFIGYYYIIIDIDEKKHLKLLKKAVIKMRDQKTCSFILRFN